MKKEFKELIIKTDTVKNLIKSRMKEEYLKLVNNKSSSTVIKNVE